MTEERKPPHRGVFALPRFRLPALLLAAALTFSAALAPSAAAASGGEAAVIPLGRAVGIKLFSDGVMVVGLAEIPTADGALAPAKECGLREGDIITHINSEEVDTIEEVQKIVQETGDDPLRIRATRGDKQLQVTAQAAHCSSDGSYRLGAWIRDSMAGIGTLTFYDPAQGSFGALGHGVNDVDTSLLMPLSSGSIMYAEVESVKKGQAGDPGELHGVFKAEEELGDLYANTPSGIFGHLSEESILSQGKAIPVALRGQVKTGPATILTNIAGDTVEEYTVEITHIYPEAAGDTRNLMLKVTDPHLLEATGGIVQGMVVRYNRDNTGKP